MLPCLEASTWSALLLWYVYFLQLKNDHIYVGSTNDLRRRIAAHANGQVASTKALQPSSLKSYVAVETETIARSLEQYFKSGSGKAVARKRFFPTLPPEFEHTPPEAR